MKRVNSLFASTRVLGSQVLEYVIIAVGIAIFCTFGILLFGKAAQGQMDAATQVLTGKSDAADKTIHDEAGKAADKSESDSTGRKGESMARK